MRRNEFRKKEPLFPYDFLYRALLNNLEYMNIPQIQMGLQNFFSTGVYSFYFVFINNSLMRGN